MLTDKDVEWAKRYQLRSIIHDRVHDNVGPSTLVYIAFRGVSEVKLNH